MSWKLVRRIGAMGALVALSATPAQAAPLTIDPTCGFKDGRYECTQTFLQSGQIFGWDLKTRNGVTFEIVGGRGGNAGDGTRGGRGGKITKTVTGVSEFCLWIGGNGGNAGASAAGAAGGAGGGGAGGNAVGGRGGGGGGGATKVMGANHLQVCNSPSVTVGIAPGGGGAGPSGGSNGGGGRGGDGGAPGGGTAYWDGMGTSNDGLGSYYCGGEAGTSSAGGRGGGRAGALRQGVTMPDGCGNYSAWIGQSGGAGQGGNGAVSTYKCVKVECLLGVTYNGGGGGGGGVYGGGGGGIPSVRSYGGGAAVAGGGGGGGGTDPVTPTDDPPSVKLTWYPTPPANLVQNGDFENPALTPNTWNAELSVPSWTEANGRPIEIENSDQAASGRQFTELDAYEANTIRQAVPTVAGKRYRFALQYAGRPGFGADQNRIRFSARDGVGAELLASVDLSADARDQARNSWKQHTATFTARSATTWVELAEIAPSNGVGMRVDGVQVYPEG